MRIRLQTWTLAGLLMVLAWAAVPSRAADESLWTDDFNAALEKAEKDNLDLLLDFTGSDWCAWCQKLKAEVWDQPEFQKAAPKQFVLVELDFPRNKPRKAANELLAAEFRVEGFPTVFLADSKGRVYARTGYQKGGAAKYLEHLTELRGRKEARDLLFASAAKAQGVERARLLDQALAPFETEGLLFGYDEDIEEIIKADAQNQAGLKNKYIARKRITEIEKLIIVAQDFKGGIAKVDAALKELDLTPDQRQYLLFHKGRAFWQLGDRAQGVQALQAAVDVDPKSEAGQAIAAKLAEVKQAEAKKKDAPPEKDAPIEP